MVAQAIHEQTDIFQCSFNELPAQAAILDSEGAIIEINSEWREFGGEACLGNKVIGENYIQVAKHSNDETGKKIGQQLEELLNGNTRIVEEEYPCDDPNTPIMEWFIIRATPFTYEGDQYYLVLHWEITSRKQLEQRLSQFNSTLRHDIRNHLSVAKGYLDLLETDDQQKKDQIKNALDNIEQTVESTTKLSELQIAKDKQQIDLKSVANTAWISIEKPDTVSLNLPETKPITADSDLLTQMFENIFKNSITHAGDAVTITVEPTREGFRVFDDGPGLSNDIDPLEIFEYGFTTGNGDGVGMAVAQQVCDAHGWKIYVNQEHDGFCLEVTTDKPVF